MKVVWKRALALMMAVLLCFSLSVPAFAVDEEGEYELSSEEVQELLMTPGASIELMSDGSARATTQSVRGPRKAAAKVVAGTLYMSSSNRGQGDTSPFASLNGASFGPLNYYKWFIGSDGSGHSAYCIDHGKDFDNGSVWATNSGAIPDDVRVALGYVLTFGFDSKSTSDISSSDYYKWVSTQYLVWATMAGNIKSANSDGTGRIVVNPNVRGNLMDNGKYEVLYKMGAVSGNMDATHAYLDDIIKKLENVRTIPSFTVEKYTKATSAMAMLDVDGTGYSKSFVDTNNVLSTFSNFHFSQDDVVYASVTTSGNTLNVKVSQSQAAGRTLIFGSGEKTIKGGDGAMTIWHNGVSSVQRFATSYDASETITAYLTLGVPDGTTTPNDPEPINDVATLRIKKTSEDGVLSGISFTVTPSDGSGTRTMTTNSSGDATLSNLPKYEQMELLNDAGEPVKDESGNTKLTDNPSKPITYTVRENEPVRYVHPTNQTFYAANGSATLSFDNRLKKWKMTFTKRDSETGTRAQGDATLGGAEYGLYKNGALIATFTTDTSGRFDTPYYPCNATYTLKELSPSTGYLLNGTTQSVGIAPENTSIEYNSTTGSGTEQVKKNYIELIKYYTDKIETSTGVETPEVGAEFEVYLTSSGSYSSAQASERDYLTTDSYGWARTKQLPYGTYTVHQVKGRDGYAKVPDFQVQVFDNFTGTLGGSNNRYSFILGDAVARSEIKIIKKDAETGRVIPVSGIGFRVKNLDTGEYVIQTVRYPTPTDIEIYYTDISGWLMLPYELTYGNYQIEEVCTAEGYVLNTDPVTFKVDGTQQVVEVVKRNVPQKAVIKVKKEGEVLAHVTEEDGVYTPKYEVQPLSGAQYKITAAENIYTGDGYLRYAYNQVVEPAMETGADGIATSPQLYLGKYYVQEIKAPDGMVLNDEKILVELTYQGQTIEVFEKNIGFTNERQKAKIHLDKEVEQDAPYRVGINGENQEIEFSLYAKEDVVAKDGTKIPADGLVEVAHVVDGNVDFTVDVPIGHYYVKETATDVHYILPSSVYEVPFDYAGQDKDIVTFHLNNEQAVLNKLIRGKVSGYKTDNDDPKLPLAGAEFGIFFVTENDFNEETAIHTVLTDVNGRFAFENVPYGTWLVKELNAPEGYVLPSDTYVIVVEKDGDVVDVTQVNVEQLGYIHLSKEGEVFASVVKEGEVYRPVYEVQGLSDAVYVITAAEDIKTPNGVLKHRSGDVVDTITTGADGTAVSKALHLGEYIVTEVKAPYGMVLNDVPQSASLTYAGQLVEVTETTVGFQNERQKAAIDLKKRLEQDVAYQVGINGEYKNVTFGLYASESIVAQDGTYIPKDGLLEVVPMPSGGILGFSADIPLGNYYVKEYSHDVHYLPMDAYNVPFEYADQRVPVVSFSLNNGEVIVNKLIRGTVEGEKYDDDDEGEQALAGATMGIFFKGTTDFTEETAIYTCVTDEDGHFAFKNVPYGEYIVREIAAPYGFILTEKQFPVNIDHDGKVITLDVLNRMQKGIINVLKQGEVFASVEESNGLYSAVYEVQGLQGAVYEIAAAEDIKTPNGRLKYEKGQVVDTITTNADGAASSISLYLGKYDVTEIKAPYGMILNDTPERVELKYAGQTVEVTDIGAGFNNERQKIAIDLTKTVESDETYGLGMNGEAEKVKFGVFAKEDIVAQDGKKIPANGLVDSKGIGEGGTIVFTVDLPLGEYYVEEYEFDEHYLPYATQDIDFKYAGQDVPTVVFHLNGGHTVANRLIRGTIVGAKWDEDGYSLGGAVMGLFTPDTEKFTKENAIVTSVSMTDGSFSFTDVPYGSWIVKEIKSPKGFVLTEESFPVTISEDGQYVEIDVVNNFIKGSIIVNKIDAKATGKKLANAVFEVYEDADFDGVYTQDVDTKVGTMIETRPGHHEFPVRIGGYFIIEKSAPSEYYERDSKAYYVFIEEDGQIAEVKNSEKGFVNAMKYGTLELSKTDVANGDPLPNAGFRVKDADGKVVAEGRSDKNGIVKFDKLPVGKYTYQEFDAPKGYIVDEREFPFEIKEAGTIVKANMTNRAKPATTTTTRKPTTGRTNPKTGDEDSWRNFALLVGALFAALATMAGLYTLNKKMRD